MADLKSIVVNKLAGLGPRWMPFADVATPDVPLSRLMRLALLQVTVGMALVLMAGTLNRVMIVELDVPASLVSIMLALPLLFAPFRAVIGFKSDTFRSALGWRRIPFIWKGTMLQFGGFAIMPFALLVLSQQGYAAEAPRWLGLSSAALAFLLVGAGLHIVQTVGLALATDLVTEEDHPKVVGLMYVMLLLGMIISAWLYGMLLVQYSPGRLIQVIQGSAVVTIALNGYAMWKQEARNPRRARDVAEEIGFSASLKALSNIRGMKPLLLLIAFGTAGFGMADVLMEPFGGQVLGMTVSETTKLTVVLALGTLVGFVGASRWLARGRAPLGVALFGALVGVPAFGVVILSASTLSIVSFVGATFAAGFGAGLFGHGTLTMTIRIAPPRQTGLALGVWGAVQTTSAGLAIAAGGALRDAMLASGDRGLDATAPYITVFAVEMALLVAALVVIVPLWMNGHKGNLRSRAPILDQARS
ncbi:PucC family protein [Pseudogemmobacter blasticus]|uniref:MFS transporter n=1 Tax=Fuscovulum blasticum DSM 2131 TaxID=1188250 RepID=A0A2T4J8X6_FUSBL|nr:PucC family protein [Fuscovulum blasticum]PTE14366.1 MFS transporter [Fuscovulum blasticum DSM 2131]